MSTDVASLARAEMAHVPLYDPDQMECAVDLSDNTNLWGMPPAAERALRETPMGSGSRYPTLYGHPLKDAIRDYLGVADVAVVSGCGSDDVLDCAMRAFGTPGKDAVAFAEPTFTMIPTFARLNGLETRAMPLADDWSVDAERLVDTGAKIIYLCTPNNPTATPMTRAAVEYVVEHAPGVVILDEAYAEFARETHIDLVARSERLHVARTMSKAFGMAGMRVGFGIGSTAVVQTVERARGPYKVTSLAERAAVAALSDDEGGRAWVLEHARLAREVRDRLAVELRTRGLTPAPSDANFCFVPHADARRIARGLAERGVRVRVHGNLPTAVAALRDAGGMALRIGVGPWDAMQTLLDALDATLGARERTRGNA